MKHENRNVKKKKPQATQEQKIMNITVNIAQETCNPGN